MFNFVRNFIRISEFATNEEDFFSDRSQINMTRFSTSFDVLHIAANYRPGIFRFRNYGTLKSRGANGEIYGGKG